eukprot:GFUD01044213.1.p1 GENE.GFUD01044213.1~~GFUD01044213.1.p1  ORF type:complete len:475 (-),score=115.31 GFUD01044213.1:97-1521(-)
MEGTIVDLQVQDIRFPTSLEADGSDAIHPDPDYSASYVTLTMDNGCKGYGLAFTLGRGNEIVCHCIDSLRFLVIGVKLQDIFADMGAWLYKTNNEGQMRWLGPEKGVIGMAVAAIVNSLWDMKARIEGKPVWKVLVDMTPEELIKLVDFTYIEDCVTKAEALEILKRNENKKVEREAILLAEGLPAYTTAAGWLGYSEEKIVKLSNQFMENGFTAFKLKVGSDVKDDIRRCGIMRKTIGWENKLMVDANQKWGVKTAIDWMKQLAEFKLLWIEEPTNPDDVLGHKAISEGLRDLGIGVATGECCQNRVMFKQFLMSGGMQFCQIDSARMSGVNEVLAVYLMAAKVGVPVCPHAGGVGLCNMVPHLQGFDFVCITGTTEDRVVEWVDHLHHHFIDPPRVTNARYVTPSAPGYSTQFKEESIKEYAYPNGTAWKTLFAEGKYRDPSMEKKLQPTFNESARVGRPPMFEDNQKSYIF